MKKIVLILSLLVAGFMNTAMAGDIKTFEIIIKNHVFIPSTVVIPAGEKVKLLIRNQDRTPEEFESYELNREKIIRGGRKAVIYVGPLKPGKYPFFGEFNMKTAKGVLIAK